MLSPPTNNSPSSIAIGQVFKNFPLTREHLKIGCILFFIFAIEAWEMMIIVYIAPLIANNLKINPIAIGELISSMFIGMTIGAVLWGSVSNQLGRKKTFIYSLLFYSFMSFLSAFSMNYYMLYSSRLLAGMAASGMLLTTFPYFEELLPIRSRGSGSVYLSAGWPTGMLLALAATYFLTPWGWRWIIGMSSAASLCAILIIYFVPESPYWLAAVNRQAEARAVISRLSRGNILVPTNQLLALEEMQQGTWSQLLSKNIFKITLTQVGINFTFAYGYWGLQTWLPTLLQERGLNLPQSISFIALSAIIMFPGYISAAYLTHKMGRKKIMIAYVATAAMAGYLFAHTQTTVLLYTSNFILSFFSMGAWGVWNAWVPELYPTNLRVLGNSCFVLGQRFATIVAPIAIGLFVEKGATFTEITTFINMFMIVTIFLSFLLPETEGRPLQ
jgi:putative MFS transporter